MSWKKIPCRGKTLLIRASHSKWVGQVWIQSKWFLSFLSGNRWHKRYQSLLENVMTKDRIRVMNGETRAMYKCHYMSFLKKLPRGRAGMSDTYANLTFIFNKWAQSKKRSGNNHQTFFLIFFISDKLFRLFPADAIKIRSRDSNLWPCSRGSRRSNSRSSSKTGNRTRFRLGPIRPIPDRRRCPWQSWSGRRNSLKFTGHSFSSAVEHMPCN